MSFWFAEHKLLIAGDTALARRASDLLSARGVAVSTMDHAADSSTPDEAFDIAFDSGATAVVLIDRLEGDGGITARPAGHLQDAAVSAARSPLVTGFGWVTSRDDQSLLSDFRQRGTPYGVLRLPPLLELEVEGPQRAARGKRALIPVDTATRAAEAGLLPIGDAAEAVAAWIEREGMRQGSLEAVPTPSDPVERAVRSLGFAPTVLSGWRVRLNRLFGAAVVERDGDRWLVRRGSPITTDKRRTSTCGAEAASG
jgi:hypothetical protein